MLLNEYIFGRIVPGVGVTLLLGNIYYSWQAIRLTNRHGRQYTAQPYGLNTPAAFAFVFNILYAVYFSNVDNIGPEAAFILAYKVPALSVFCWVSLDLSFSRPFLLRRSSFPLRVLVWHFWVWNSSPTVLRRPSLAILPSCGSTWAGTQVCVLAMAIFDAQKLSK